MDLTTGAQPSGRRRWAWWVALLVALSLLAAACGGGDDDDDGATGSTDTEDAGGDVDPNGVLRVGQNIAGSQQDFHFDPAASTLRTDLAWMAVVMGTLLRESAEGVVEPWLAESVEVADPQTITLTLREGLTFSDGTPLDGEAVRKGLLRTRDQATEAATGAQQAGFKILQDVVVDSPTQVSIELSTPESTEFLWALAGREGVIVSPKQADLPLGAIDEAPIGAGPYKVKTLEQGQTIVVEKNEDFFDADEWRIREIQWIQVPGGPAATNGLLSDTFDLTPQLAPDDVPKIEADSRFTAYQHSTDSSFISMPMCTDLPPFDKLEVRQALQAAVDREALIKLAYDGRAEPMLGLWPEGHANFNPAVKKLRAHDPAKARKLLADAGVKDLEFDLWLLGGLGYERMVEVLQAQFEEVGITMNIKPSTDILADFLAAHRPGATIIPNIRQRVDKYNRLYGDAVSVTCGRKDDIMKAVRVTSTLAPDDPEVAKAFREGELLAAEWASPLPLIFLPDNVAWSKDKIGGTPKFQPSSRAPEGVMYDSFYIKK